MKNLKEKTAILKLINFNNKKTFPLNEFHTQTITNIQNEICLFAFISLNLKRMCLRYNSFLNCTSRSMCKLNLPKMHNFPFYWTFWCCFVFEINFAICSSSFFIIGITVYYAISKYAKIIHVFFNLIYIINTKKSSK
jgi:hypothetical protein